VILVLEYKVIRVYRVLMAILERKEIRAVAFRVIRGRRE
jgi:hypothetical protein